MNKDEALRLALEALEDLGMKHYENTGEVLYKETFTAIKAALEAKDEPVKLRRGDILRCIETDELCTVWATSTSGKTLVKWGGNDFTDYTAEQIGELFWIEPKEQNEKHGSPCPEFWDWLPKAYRDGDMDDEPKFTKYNMEVAFLAGKQSFALEAKDEPDAYGYAKRLAEAIWSKHYKTIAPQWEPFDELIGVLTQIDNMTAGLISTPQQEAKDEPVAIFKADLDGGYVDLLAFQGQPLSDNTLLYTTPPQRTWVGLTDGEISDCMEMSIQKTCRAIEAKLKAKNT